MNPTLAKITENVVAGRVRVSEHALQELNDDAIDLRDVISGLATAALVEDYPDYWKGPCILCLQHDRDGHVIHVLWGIAKQATETATVITAYRPDPARWSADFMTRNRK